MIINALVLIVVVIILLWLAGLPSWIEHAERYLGAKPMPEPLVPSAYHEIKILKDDLYARAQTLIAEAEQLDPATSGEYKRWTYVAGKLRREFPARMHEVGLVIEAVLRG